MAEEVKVLGLWASPFSLRVQIALNLKGLSYDYIEEDLSNKSQLLLQSNPVYKKIPVLIHNGRAICESQIILQYIDETWPGVPLLPRDPYQRAMARFWAAFYDDKLAPTLIGVYRTQGEKQQKAIEELLANVLLLEEALATTFNGGPFFGGESIGFLDVVLGSRAVWLRAAEEIGGVKFIDTQRTPLIYAWLQRFSNVEFVKKSLPEFDKLVAYAYNIRNRSLQSQPKP
uniref:glutathione transferase n=1 Tax=Araucaria cunninghamii TaxID=56994 RepID=A0A0D6QT50_ARACU